MRTERFRKRGESSSCGRDHRHTGGQSPPSGCHGLLAFPKQAAFRAQRGHLRRRPSRSTHFGCPRIWRPTPSSRPRTNLAIASYTLESEDVCGPAGRRGASSVDVNFVNQSGSPMQCPTANGAIADLMALPRLINR